MEASPGLTNDWFGKILNNQRPLPQPKAQPKQQARKRQMEEELAKEGSGSRAPAGIQRNPKTVKKQGEQLTPSQVEARRKAQDKESFSQIFRKRPQEPQGAGSGSDQSSSEAESTHTNGQTPFEPEADPGGSRESVNQRFGQASSSSYRTGSYPLVAISN
eukprot:16441032-Heterocapsa_arctica.AAC.1